MTESKLDTTPGTKASEENSSSVSNNPPPAYPYSQILQQLQSKAIQAQDPDFLSNDNEEKVESSHATTTTTTRHSQTPSQPWDLSADALLATLLHEFSSHVASRSHHVASDIRQLQNSINESGVDVAICQTEFMKRSNEIFMEQVVGDEESESELEGDEVGVVGDVVDNDNKDIQRKEERTDGRDEDEDDDIDDNSSADIARLEAEEKSAIADGMKALELFFDPKRPNQSSGDGSNGSGGGEGDTMIDVEEDIIGENCYYYASAEADGFNQRPLPFIVGSREFMESSCAGLGGDIVGGDDDE
mmetsp:Transcript_4591/g.10075  ORF Transcript_4591/g.10075 Transcript_4591/m.10075 type:complete len:302 (-) Transcript_4591:162-1067(-)